MAIGATHLPTWKNEGLADYVANESSFPYDKGIHLMATNSADNSNSYLYFKYRIVTTYVIEQEGLSVKQFLADARPFDYWLDRFIKFH